MYNYNPNTKQLARNNRRQRNATKQEGILWHMYLKNSKVKFYRQYRVDNYILDFYSPKAKLAIELDGGGHFEEDAITYDENRTAELNSLGIRVVRFLNSDIDNNLYGVIDEIERILFQTMSK